MPALHIRDVDEKLVQRLKADAALNGITLREHVIERLGGEKVADRRAKDVPRSEGIPVPKRGTGRSERVSASIAHCEHGVEKGWHCWQCGGLAKAGEKK